MKDFIKGWLAQPYNDVAKEIDKMVCNPTLSGARPCIPPPPPPPRPASGKYLRQLLWARFSGSLSEEEMDTMLNNIDLIKNFLETIKE